jgi:hypothetical protein
MDWVQIIPLLVSLTFSVLLVLYIQWVKKPQLETQISDYSYHNDNRMKIAHIRVRNKPVRFLGR